MINIAMPDTVIFRGEQPTDWYFSSNARVKAKMRSKLTLEEIKSAFVRRVPECGIVATFMVLGEKEDGAEIVFEHFDKEGLGRRGVTKSGFSTGSGSSRTAYCSGSWSRRESGTVGDSFGLWWVLHLQSRLERWWVRGWDRVCSWEPDRWERASLASLSVSV